MFQKQKIFRALLVFVLLFSMFTMTAQAAGNGQPAGSVQQQFAQGLVIDHTSVALYDQIPAEYLRAAERLRFVFMDRSVGANIYDGLGCLSAASWGASPANCRRAYVDSSLTTWKTYMPSDSNIPAEIRFPGGNNRDNIQFLSGAGSWEEDLANFINLYPSYADRDIFTLQHNYLHVAAGSTIDNVYFDPNYGGTNIYDVLALEAQYPNKTFVYWTTSLARTVGTQDAQSFNDQMRAWARANGKVLLDVAAIESHAPDGAVCRNGQGYEVICVHYTTESDGGHLGSVSAGKIQIAKAMWVMLAQLAGWNPGHPGQNPTQVPTQIATAMPTVTANPTAQPTATAYPTVQPTQQPTAMPSPTATVVVPPPSGNGLVIDHTSVALYDQIPAEYLRAAERLRFVFMDRSVGANIYDGLGCLSAASWGASPANCRRAYVDSSLTTWKTYMPSDSNIPAEIRFPGGNNRDNIQFLSGAGSWEEDLANFINMYPSYADRDIFTLQHNYLHVAAGSTIDNVYFDPNYGGTNIYDVLALEAQYPDKTFVYWTTSLARTVGTQDAQSFNDQMRAWARANGKVLLDVAAIESHAPDGAVCRNGQGYDVICVHYTTESDGGHLGSVSAGKIQIAKAIWVMLAQLAGWVPN